VMNCWRGRPDLNRHLLDRQTGGDDPIRTDGAFQKGTPR
jgi:hypothetical protein